MSATARTSLVALAVLLFCASDVHGRTQTVEATALTVWVLVRSKCVQRATKEYIDRDSLRLQSQLFLKCRG